MHFPGTWGYQPYDPKGYQLYDPKWARVFYSWDVLFNESDRGVEKEPSEQEKKRYNFDYFSNKELAADEELVADEAAEPVLGRSERERQPPNYYGARVTIANDKLKEPSNVEEALASPDKTKWIKANGNGN